MMHPRSLNPFDFVSSIVMSDSMVFWEYFLYLYSDILTSLNFLRVCSQNFRPRFPTNLLSAAISQDIIFGIDHLSILVRFDASPKNNDDDWCLVVIDA